MEFRKATIEDAPIIKDFLFQAMEDLVYYMIGKVDQLEGKMFFQKMVELPMSQYSYNNCFVIENNQKVIAALNIYDGKDLTILRKPVLDYLQTHYNRTIHPEDETQAGEFYIDTFGVDTSVQGKGIGTALLKYVIEYYVKDRGETIGLLVDLDNPNAKRLYEKLGFITIGRQTLMGHTLEHMQMSATKKEA